MSDDSDINAQEAAYWWGIRAFRDYRFSRKFCTNQTNPWPSDRGLIDEFKRSSYYDGSDFDPEGYAQEAA